MFYRIGNLVVRSPYSIRRPKRGEDCLIIKTHRSFPPAHPSTKAALTVLQRLKVKKEARILDIGCGSGVLGLAAVLKNGAVVLGCDISLAAIRASVQNATFNRMADSLHLFHGSADAVKGRFQLILANLPAAVHRKMYDHYRRLTLPDESLLVVSGFCDVNTVEIEKELAQRGFVVLEKVIVNAWAAEITPEYTYTWLGLGLKRA
jgi:ribosomal protein L11 methyltransferase